MGGQESSPNTQMQMSTNDVVAIKNIMQQELAKRHGEDIYYFIENHAKDFGDFVGANQSVLEQYRHDPEGAIQEMEKVIYH